VALRDGNRVHYEVLRGYSADIKAGWADFTMNEPLPTTYVISTGIPVFVESREQLEGLYDNARLRAFVEATGEHAWVRLPLKTASGVLGALVFGFDRPRTFSEDERNFALALAGQCAQAIERARLYERERSTAQVLQRSLLPDALPAVPGAQLSALCQPASADVEVGGDWYDAIVLADGRLAVVVGDVMGKGVRAASVMGQVRNALRGLIQAETSPHLVLSWLDGVVGQLGNDEELVTLVYGLFDPATGDFEWSSAAHMPLLLLYPGGAKLIETEEYLPLGMGGERANERLRVEPGQALVLFSDGLVESRARPLVDGLDQLVTHARALAHDGLPEDPDVIRDRLVTLMVEPSDNDDVTVLVLRRSAGDGDESVPMLEAEIVLPARAASAGGGRQFVAARLAEWQLDHVTDAVLVCVSEVITNAVVHAGSHAELSMRVSRGVLRVDVRDVGASGIPTVRPPATPEDTHGRGLLLVEALSDKWGTIGEGGSKVVWFEMSTTEEANEQGDS
jgi:serine phosphatase RsbU (regulator of sigma subunit)/anti-sigma regulatory factor (Ser/Thr protein kinase)